MNTPSHGFFPELLTLLDALCEETITSEQVERLEELVLSHPEAEAFYVQHMAFYADLVRHFKALPGQSDQINDRPSAIAGTLTPRDHAAGAKAGPVRSGRRWRSQGGGVFGLAVAAALLVAVALWPRPHHHGVPTPAQPPEVIDHTVAVMRQALGTVWGETGQVVRAGVPLSPGWLYLKSGSAQVEFYNGASVILEGPVEFKLMSRTEAYCARGKLRATVPPQAVGFIIGSPKLDVVDRGTEFGLQVSAEGKTEVHVFQGKVELHDPGSDHKAVAPQELTTGQSVRLDSLAKIHAIKLNPDAFPTAQNLAERLRTEIQRRRQNWLAASAGWRKDPDLLVYYTFENEEAWSLTLLDQASQRQQPRDGAMVGCSWAGGRWPGKQGLEFKRRSDRVRFHVPGEFESITLMAWVRVDILPNRNNSLMMSDGWDPGGLHWQIGDDGTIILGVQGNPKGKGAHYHAPEVFTPDRFGQWIHLAVVYDQANSQVTHYVDGRPAAQTPVLFDIPLVVGDAQVGNWDVATHRNNTPVRNFNGCMDEFLMYSRPLSEQEVEQHYAKGQPPQ